LLPARLDEEIFKKNGAGDGIVERVMGFTARAEIPDTGFEF
jgi:hypothetical protein